MPKIGGSTMLWWALGLAATTWSVFAWRASRFRQLHED